MWENIAVRQNKRANDYSNSTAKLTAILLQSEFLGGKNVKAGEKFLEMLPFPLPRKKGEKNINISSLAKEAFLLDLKNGNIENFVFYAAKNNKELAAFLEL